MASLELGFGIQEQTRVENPFCSNRHKGCAAARVGLYRKRNIERAATERSEAMAQTCVSSLRSKGDARGGHQIW